MEFDRYLPLLFIIWIKSLENNHAVFYLRGMNKPKQKGVRMKNKIALLLSAVCVVSVPLMAGGSSPTDTKQPPKQPAGTTQIARGGEDRDNSLENRENRAGDTGDTQRESNLENRQDNAESRQDNR